MKVCKNVWLLVSLLCLFCTCKEREHDRFTISGVMEGLPRGVVKLYTNPPGNVLLDSCEVKDGKYFLEGKITEPQVGLLFFDMESQYQRLGASMVAIFIEPEDMKVYSELNDVKKTLKFTSAPINEDIQKYNVYLKSLPEKQMVAELNGKIQMAFAEARMEEVREMSRKRDSLQMVIIDRLFAFEPGVSKSQAAAYLVAQLSASLDVVQRGKIVEKFDPSFTDSYYLNGMQESVERETALQPGKAFPDFQVFDKDGRKYTLADFRGKYLFVEFSASWCGWCKKEIPFIRKAYHALKDKNVAFVTMMMDDRKEAWLHEIKEYNIEWYCLSDLKGMKNSPLTKAYNLGGIPDSFVVDPEGRIVCRDLRGNEVLETLSTLCN